MSDKDSIKELFQKELGNYQAKVNPNLWNGIQAGIGQSATGIGSSLSLATKAIIGGSVAAAIVVGTVLLVNQQKEKSVSKEIVQIESKSTNEEEKTELILPLEEESSSLTKTSEEKQIENNSPVFESMEIISEKTLEDNSIELQEIEQNDFPSISKENRTDTKNTIVPSDEVVKPDKSEVFVNNVEELSFDKTQETIDLSQVDIRITQKNNQFFSFSPENLTEIDENLEITWDFGNGNYNHQLSCEHFYAEPGKYKVRLIIRSEEEEIERIENIFVQIQGEIGELPNIFTPNGDGKNDEFFISCKYLKSFQLTVLDQQQNTVFSTNNPDFRWNGMDNSGNLVKSGNYIYIIIAEDEAGNTINKYQQLIIQR